jgi:hypothetical protein
MGKAWTSSCTAFSLRPIFTGSLKWPGSNSGETHNLKTSLSAVTIMFNFLEVVSKASPVLTIPTN